MIWRAQEAPGGLMMNVGLAGVQLEGQHDLQLYLWSTMNPRIVTTGAYLRLSCSLLHDSNTRRSKCIQQCQLSIHSCAQTPAVPNFAAACPCDVYQSNLLASCSQELLWHQGPFLGRTSRMHLLRTLQGC